MQALLDDFGKLLLRIALGGCMLFHGIYKLNNSEDTLKFMAMMLTKSGLPEILKYGVFVGEVLVPVLLIIGFMTRLGGLVLAVNMAMAIYLVHLADITMYLEKSGAWAIELPVLYLAGGLSLAFMGGGKFGVWRRGGILG